MCARCLPSRAHTPHIYLYAVVTLVTEGRVEDKDVDLKGDSRFFLGGGMNTQSSKISRID